MGLFPITGAAPPADFNQLAVRSRERCCRGASPEPKESNEAGWVERGSPRRAGDDEEFGGEVDDGRSSDNWLPATKLWMEVNYVVMQSSSKWWQGRRCTDRGW
jgi:hypothetical protein